MYDSPFRGSFYYQKYTDKQLESLANLMVYLADTYNIPKDYIWGNSGILNFENEILNYFKDVLIDYFIVVAVNFFVIAFRFFSETQHEKKQMLLKIKS